jgi:histidinol-phosphate aminotransferase
MPLPPPTPAVAGLDAYRVPRHPAPLDLFLDGIGGLPTPPGIFRPLATADVASLVRAYPSTAGLTEALARRHGLEAERVLVTAGADDALDRACRALLAPGRNLVLPEPTFEMIRRYARWTGSEVRSVPWPGGGYPLEAVLAAVDETTTAIAVVSPNNPTGATATVAQLRALSAAAPHAVLLVDLAYVEFAEVDPTEVVTALPNAIAIRTMSKAYGLAGLRVGYALGPAEVIGWMRAAGNPYTVTGPSAAIAEARLTQGAPEVAAYVAAVRRQRGALAETLTTLGAAAQPSEANFVFARHPHAAWLRDALAGLGIAVRTWPDHPALGDAVRINVPGDAHVAQRLTDGLHAALAPDAVLFDLDGVLADVSHSYRAAIAQTAAAFGAPVTPAEIRAEKAKGNANNDWILTHRLIAARGRTVPLDAVIADFEARYQGTEGIPGLKETERLIWPADALARLAARRPLAVVTGRPRADAQAFLHQHGLLPYFRAVVVMEDGPAKPDPFPVREALRRLGARTAWMIGDTPDDLRAARAAGVVPLGVVAPGEDPDTARATLTAAGAARVLTDPLALEELLP